MLGFCFDSGHSLFGGGDPVAFLDTYGELVTHVHLKDVDGAVMDEIRSRGLGMEEAWRRGVFCLFGEGSVDLAAIVARLRALGYDDWVVVEQDRHLKPRADDRVADRGRPPQPRGAAGAGGVAAESGQVFAPAFPIETERLLLRPYAPGDFDALLAIQSRADVNRFLYSEPRGAGRGAGDPGAQDRRDGAAATRATRSPWPSRCARPAR